MTVTLLDYLPSIGMLIVGFGAIFLWYMLKGRRWTYLFYFILGAILWTIAIAPKYILDYTITTPFDNMLVTSLPILAAVIIIALYFGLRTGFFESGFSYLILKYTGLANMNFNEAVALGIGFGGFEAIFLGSQTLLSVNPQTSLPLDPLSYIIVWERLFALFGHVFATVLVVYAVKLNDRRWLWLSIIYKTACDSALVLVPYFLGTGINTTYIFQSYVAVLGIIGIIGLYWISKKYGGDSSTASSNVTGRNTKNIIMVTALLAAVAAILAVAAFSLSSTYNNASQGTSINAASAEANAAANATADRVLNSLDTDNYTEFLVNSSPAVLSAMNENLFDTVRNDIRSKYGSYVSRDPLPTLVTGQGNNKYLYNSHFENGDLTLVLSMNTTNVWRVEGIGFK